MAIFNLVDTECHQAAIRAGATYRKTFLSPNNYDGWNAKVIFKSKFGSDGDILLEKELKPPEYKQVVICGDEVWRSQVNLILNIFETKDLGEQWEERIIKAIPEFRNVEGGNRFVYMILIRNNLQVIRMLEGILLIRLA